MALATGAILAVLATGALAEDEPSVEIVESPAEVPADWEEPAPPPPIAAGTEDLVFGLREPLVALGNERYGRVRRSTSVYLVTAGLEGGAGMLMATTGREPGVQEAGGLLVFGAAMHALQAWYQLDLAQRRHASFMADLAASRPTPAAWEGIADAQRLSLEREARAHAFGAGIYSSLLGFGLLSLVASAGDAESADLGVALSIVGAAGLVQHSARWRASVRLSADLDALNANVPTVVP